MNAQMRSSALVLILAVAGCAKPDGNSSPPPPPPPPEVRTADKLDQFRPYLFAKVGSCTEGSVIYRYLKGERRTKPFGGAEKLAELTLVLFANGLYRARYFEREPIATTSRERTELHELIGRYTVVDDRLWLDGIGEAEPVRSGEMRAMRIRFAKNLGSYDLEGDVIGLETHASAEPPFSDLKACSPKTN